ncbi:MAG: hypothetical protein K2J36_10115, partial [Ruminococcus sp.]|nr:hypothetical protein [Ruminococcus sp.]
YNISDKYKKYFSDVNNKSWENIKYYTEHSDNSKWKGSCYGLACVQILAKSGLLKVSDIEKNAGSLYDLSAPKDNENVESLINFYHLQQYTENGDKKLKSMLASMSNSARVDKVIDFAKKAQNGDTPALLVFNFSSNKNEGKLKEAHAVVIYGIEYGDWTIDKCGDKYDCRILISDSNTTGFDKDYCMYINTKNHSWEIPYYDNNGMGYCKNTNSRNDSYAQIQYVTNDLAFIDQLQYASSDTKPTEETPDYSSISINTSDTSFGVSYYENNSSGINSSVIDLIYFGSSINGAGDNTVNAILPTADVSYEYDAKDKADFNTVIDYTNSRLGADVKNGSYAVYKPDKSVEFHGDNSEYSLSMILNKGYHPTDWYKIKVSGDNADNALLRVTDEGYVLESDNL